MKILTIGSGFVADHLPYEKIVEKIPINRGYIKSIIDQYKPDTIVNCIGKTGRPNIDWCEDNKIETAISNTIVPLLLAEACEKSSIHMIQVGSGCVYAGPTPKIANDLERWGDLGMEDSEFVEYETGWREFDDANPVSYYSNTKYACDLLIGSLPQVTTLRIRMPISTKNNSRNLINKLRGYKKIINIPNSVTFMDDFIRCVDWVIQQRHTGIFHVTNEEPLTAVQIMTEYQKYVPSHTFEIMSEKQLCESTLAQRSNCILNSSKLYHAGFKMTPSQEALERCMLEYVKNI